MIRTAKRLGVSHVTLAHIIGIDAASASALACGAYTLDPSRKEWELAVLFVRLYRSLVSVVGSDETVRRWMSSRNHALTDTPMNVMTQPRGIVEVLAYVDRHRGQTPA